MPDIHSSRISGNGTQCLRKQKPLQSFRGDLENTAKIRMTLLKRYFKLGFSLPLLLRQIQQILSNVLHKEPKNQGNVYFSQYNLNCSDWEF